MNTKIRIGKDLRVYFTVLTNGADEPLEGRDLTLELVHRNWRRRVPFSITGPNTVVFLYYGRDQRDMGLYTMTLWENFGKDSQTVVDTCSGFELVSSTCCERDGDSSLDIESIDLGAVCLEAGVKGDSAYEIAVKYGYTGTEEEYAEGPILAGDAARHPPKIIDGEWWTYNVDLKIYENTGHTAGISPQVYPIESKPMEIMHKRDSYPSVTVIDGEGDEVEAVVEYIDRDTVRVDWNGDLEGVIYII